MKIVLRWFLVLFLFQLSSAASSAAPSSNRDETPTFFQQFGESDVHFHHSPNEVLWHPKSKLLPEVMTTLNPFRQQTTSAKSAYEKGQKRTFSSRHLYVDKIKYTHEHTQVNEVAMGEIIGNGEHWYYQSTPEGTWSVDLNLHTYASLPRVKDTIGEASLARKYVERYKTGVVSKNNLTLDSSNAQTIIVDVMLLYTQNIADVFPGDLLLALMEHLIAKSNQTFVNSDIDVQLRLVRVEFVDYPKPSSRTAINDLTVSLIPENTSIEPSLANVRQWRDESGADIVSMIRTHNLNEREVCGIAQFPNSQSDVLVNVSNVGISGGSNCSLTFTHEIGHNFGAGHQQVNGSSVGALPTSGALIVSEKFNTIMSSIGTGDENRNYKLPIFSNLAYLCGGQNCGDSQVADNASTVEAFALQNSNLRETVIPVDNISTFIRTRPDSDGDGVVDDEDAFPFLASESADSDNDGVGDNTDQFPFDAGEFLDTDNDGIGNNADTDDDNDNTSDNFDALPLIASEQFDDDNDGIGNNADEVDNDFQEFRDSDNDGLGDLFDVDDDNDGVNEYFTPNAIETSNVMVVSANTHQIVEFDAQTGNEIGVAATTLPGGLTFRSDIVLSPSGQVFFIAFSDVYRLDRQDGTVTNVIDRSRLQTNFPAHLTFSDARTLLVNNGLGNSFIEAFEFQSSETALTRQEFSQEVYRDNVIINGDELLIVNRSENNIQKLDLSALSPSLELFTDQGLDFPEQLAVDNLGRIYVTNAGNGSITSYDSNGNFTGTLVAGGAIQPTCLAVGPDQLLYVCDELGNRIVRYSLSTGALVDEFISGSNTSIDRPMGLAFVGKVADDLPFDPTNDTDLDGTANNQDAFPLDETETTDTDNDGIGNNADTDDDNDGMSDAFEEQFNFDPLNPADASQDPDNDGLTNLAEFNRGTDPLVANVIEEPSSSGGGGALKFIWLALLMIIWRCRRHSI